MYRISNTGSTSQETFTSLSVFLITGSQSEVLRPATSVSSGDLSERQRVGPHPRSATSETLGTQSSNLPVVTSTLGDGGTC